MWAAFGKGMSGELFAATLAIQALRITAEPWHPEVEHTWVAGSTGARPAVFMAEGGGKA